MKRSNNRRHILAVTFVMLGGVLFFQLSTRMDDPAEAKSLRSAAGPQQVARIPSGKDLSAISVRTALERHEELLQKTVVVRFVDETGVTVTEWKVIMKDHPLWILFHRDDGGSVNIDRERLKQELISYPPEGIPAPALCSVLSSEKDEEGIERVKTDCIAKTGYTYDPALVAHATADAIEKGQESTTIQLTRVEARITDPLHSPDRPLTLLATGRSTFTGSGYGRKQNVRKAVNEREHNILIPPDGIFAFNDTLGIVSVNRGWQLALTIFEGVNLRPAPGGGICQASTTVYRAALNAGLPILEQKPHSLYVTYYEAHGVGLDATVFPGKQDFKFKNDTGGPLLMQAYTEGDEVTVNLYGYDDSRKVAITGPYFAGTAPQDLLVDGKKLKPNQIVWLRTIEQSGEKKEETISARYNAIPKSLPKKWTATTVVTRGESMETAAIQPDIVATER